MTHRPCLALAGRSLSYNEVVELASSIEAVLARMGIEPGECKDYMGLPHTVFTLSCFAICHIGAVYVRLNPL